MPLARLHVPHGGATKTPARFGELIQVRHKSWPCLEVRSATKTFPACFKSLWSTPKDPFNPRCLRQEVTRAVPAQISIKNGASIGEVFGEHGTKRRLSDLLGSECMLSSLFENSAVPTDGASCNGG